MAGEQATGRLVGQPEAILAKLEADALARIGGQVTSVSEAGGGHGKSVGESPWRVLAEVEFARKAAGGILPPRRTRPDYGGSCGFTPHDPSRGIY